MPNTRTQTDRPCSLCGVEPATVYASQPHCYWCETCRKKKNKEQYSKRMARHGVAERERQRIWARNNPEKTREATRRWRNAHPGRCAEFTRKYRQRRFFMYASNCLKVLTGIRVPALALWGLWKKQSGRCGLTGRKLDGRKRYNASLDHTISQCKGGLTEPSNLRWVCLEANLAKHKLSDEQFVALCSDVVKHMNNGGKSSGGPT